MSGLCRHTQSIQNWRCASPVSFSPLHFLAPWTSFAWSIMLFNNRTLSVSDIGNIQNKVHCSSSAKNLSHLRFSLSNFSTAAVCVAEGASCCQTDFFATNGANIFFFVFFYATSRLISVIACIKFCFATRSRVMKF